MSREDITYIRYNDVRLLHDLTVLEINPSLPAAGRHRRPVWTRSAWECSRHRFTASSVNGCSSLHGCLNSVKGPRRLTPARCSKSVTPETHRVQLCLRCPHNKTIIWVINHLLISAALCRKLLLPHTLIGLSIDSSYALKIAARVALSTIILNVISRPLSSLGYMLSELLK